MNDAHCVLEIDLLKIRNNYRIISRICSGSKIGAIVKANSYGLGVNIIAPILQQENCQDFFVTSIDEAINLRKILGEVANIFVFNGVFHNDITAMKHHNLVPVLNSLQQIEIWREFASSQEEQLPCILHIDTGMNRFGITNVELEQLRNKLDLLQGLKLQYIISHLSVSEEFGHLYNVEQLAKFTRYLQYFPKIRASLASSGGIFLGPDYHFHLVRPGGALYGLNQTGNDLHPIRNPVTLTAPIIQLQELSPRSYIGYNMTFITNRQSIIATLPLGYADGYSRVFTNCGEVFIDHHMAPVVGRISMDLINIDVTDVPSHKIFLGQKVEIIGNYCTPDRMANMVGTIGYEILTTLGNRYRRIYKNDN